MSRRYVWVTVLSACVLASGACKEGAGGKEDAPAKPAQTAAQKAPEEKPPEEVEPVHGPLEPGTKAQQNALAKAKVFYLKGDFEQAEVLFEALTRSLPISSEVVSAGLALGDIYTKQGRDEDAIELYTFILERAPDTPEVHLVVGRAHAAAGRRDLAVASFGKALELQPSYLFLWVELGQLHAARGEQEESAKAFVKYEQEIARLSAILEGGEAEAIEDRVEIVDILSFVEDERAVAALVKALSEDPSEAVRARAARALADSYALSAREPLERARAKDPSEAVRGAATAALKDLDTMQAEVEAAGGGEPAEPAEP
jgi:tetratricopeptide (TPR) repeat protein